MERTLALIKPDAVRQFHVGKIMKMIESAGLRVVSKSQVQLTRAWANDFYHAHFGKPFYDGLTTFMSSGPCVVLVLEGENAIDQWRELMGATDPKSAKEGTIRHLFGSREIIRENAVHGSDSEEAAVREIAFFQAELQGT